MTSNLIEHDQPRHFITEKHFNISIPAAVYASPTPMATDLLDAFDSSLTTITKNPNWDFITPIATLRTVKKVIEQCPDKELVEEFRSFCQDKRFTPYLPIDSTAGKAILKEGTRGFDHVFLPNSAYVELPQRASSTSPGYVFNLPYAVELCANMLTYIPTGIKAFMPKDEYLELTLLAQPAKYLSIPGSKLIIEQAQAQDDAGGEIVLIVKNGNEHSVLLPRGYALMQGIFKKYQTTALDIPKEGTK